MTTAMKVRLVIASCLVAVLTGCVRLGSTNLLLTPVGVVGVHSFEPPAGQGRDVLAESHGGLLDEGAEAAREEAVVQQALSQ